MNNNPFEQPVSPASPNLGEPNQGGQTTPGAEPASPTPPPANPVSQTPPANPFDAPSPAPAESKSISEESQPVPVVSKNNQPGMAGNSDNQPDMSNMYQPVNNDQPSSGKGLLVLIIVLIVILVLGGLFFASWEGWINLGGIEKYWKKTETTNTNTNTNTPVNTASANDQQRKTDLANIKTALAAYYQANQSYPVAATEQKTSDPNCVLNTLVPTYLASLPVDPQSPVKYYAYKSDGKSYTLTCVLEDTSDPLGIQVGNYFIYKVTNTSVETPQASNTTSSTNSNTDTTTTSNSNSETSGSANANAIAE